MKRRWPGAAVSLLCLALGCGGSASNDAPLATVDPLQDVGSSMAELRRDLESTVLENYSHLSLGNIDAYADSVAQDEPIALIGPRASDLVVDGAVFRQRRDRRLYRDRDVEVLSKRLEMHLADDGSLAWVADELSYRVPYAGREAALPLRYTAVWVRKSGRWVLVAEHMSYPVPFDDLVTLARAGELSRLRTLGTEVEESAAAPAEVTARIHNAIPEEREVHLSTSPSSLSWLPHPAGEYRGPAIAGAPRLTELTGNRGVLQRTGLIAQMAASPEVAWVAEHAMLRTRAYGDEIAIPLRILYVLERTDQDWQIVQMHASAPLTDAQLNLRVFGESRLSDRDRPVAAGTDPTPDAPGKSSSRDR